MSVTLQIAAALQATAPVPPQVPPVQSGAGEEIIITAQRREERLQDVPIAVSVVSGAQLERTGTYNIGRLIQLQPSVQFYTSNPRNSAINIRGLGAPFGLTNDGIEQGVGLYIDQVYYSRPAAASFDFVDVDRIEVLRGPQGTLYGKNTTAGAITITSRPPSFTPEGRIEVSIGNLGFVQAKASVSGPLGPDIAARIAASSTGRQGTILNVRSGERVNGIDNLGLRGTVLWNAGDDLEITLSADFSRQDPRCCTQVFARVAPTQRAANRQFEALAAASGYAPPSRNAFARLTDVDTPLRARQEFGGASLRAEWDVGAGTLTSVTAWRFWNWDPSNDRDFLGLPITTISANPSRQRQFTQEIRFASASGGAIDYTLGVFAYRQTIASTGLQEQGRAAALWLSGPAAVPNAVALDGYRQTTRIDFTNDSLAGFGRLTWHITDRLRLTPGLRVNWDRKDADYDARVSGGPAAPTAAQRALQLATLAPQAYRARFADVNLSGDVTLAWKLADDVLAFATYARSFKPGGVNLGGLPTDAAGNPVLRLASVRPETVNHYEIGLKSQFFDRRLTVNIAAYRTDIRDYQTTVVNGQAGVLRGYLANAERVRVQGVEVDVAARPAAGLSLYASAAYTDGVYQRFVDAPSPIEVTGGPQAVDISGQKLPGISRWALSAGGEYAAAIGGGTEAFFGADISYRSSFSSTPTPSAFTRIDGYTLTSWRAGLRTESGWTGFLWIRNAFDTDYFEFLSIQPGNTGLIVGQPGDPRTFGVTIGRTF